jgi:hypothetical protein
MEHALMFTGCVVLVDKSVSEGRDSEGAVFVYKA